MQPLSAYLQHPNKQDFQQQAATEDRSQQRMDALAAQLQTDTEPHARHAASATAVQALLQQLPPAGARLLQALLAALAALVEPTCSHCAELEGQLAAARQQSDALALRIDNLLLERARVQEEAEESAAALAAARAQMEQQARQVQELEAELDAAGAAAAAGAAVGQHAGGPPLAPGAAPREAADEEEEAQAFLSARSAAAALPTGRSAGGGSDVNTARVWVLQPEDVTWGRTLTARPPLPRPPHVPPVALGKVRQQHQRKVQVQ